MPYVRVAHRPAARVRPVVPQNRPVKPRPVAPRVLPVLHAPTYFQQSEYIYEEEDDDQQQLENRTYNHLTTMGTDLSTKITQPISIRYPTFIPKHQLPPLTTRHATNLYTTR